MMFQTHKLIFFFCGTKKGEYVSHQTIKSSLSTIFECELNMDVNDVSVNNVRSLHKAIARSLMDNFFLKIIINNLQIIITHHIDRMG